MKNLLKYAILLALPVSLWAQNTAVERGPEYVFNRGMELFDQRLYAAASAQFDAILESSLPAQSHLMEESSYHRALCALYLTHSNSDYYFEQFVQNYPLSPRWVDAHLTASNYHFSNRRYRKALPYLEDLDPMDVPSKLRSDYYFKLAYSYYKTDDLDKARNFFYQGTTIAGPFQSHHRYYYGHIAYEAAQYTTAKEQFVQLVGDEEFGGMMPFYLCQIYFKTGDIDQLIETGVALLDQAEPSRASEVAKLIGEGYYQRKDWANAAVYLEKQKSLGGQLTVSDHYKLGFVLYKTRRYEEAVDAFNKIHQRTDDLGQSAYYHLADCYLKLNKPTEAQAAFLKASESGDDVAVQEDAFYNYAKLAYQASTPFEQPLELFKTFLKRYPNSARRSEANEYLANLYLNSKDYDNALKAIKDAGLDQPTMQAAYQKVAYFRGVQHFNATQYPAAHALFEESLNYPLNNTYKALAHYWLAEIAYRTKDFATAIDQWALFNKVPGSANLSEYKRSLYNTAYAHFTLENYAQAATTYRLFLAKEPAGTRLSSDAQLRLADSYFMTSQYNNAIQFYGEYLLRSVPDPDYAMFQRALCYGLIEDRPKKAAQLETLVKEHPTSIYATDAYFELGETYLKMGERQQAEKIFIAFISKYPESRFVRNAEIALGLILVNQGQSLAALEKFKGVVEKYPNTREGTQALGLAKIQFAEQNNLAGYVDWVQSLTSTDIGQGQLDSTLYNNAFDRYSFDDCSGTVIGMQQYLSKFPDGIFRTPAHYYLAECAFALEQDEVAKDAYEVVAQSGDLGFRKRTVERLATIYYAELNYEKAYLYFEQVLGLVGNADEGRRARLGLMRCAQQLDRDDALLQYAESLLQDEGLPTGWRSEALLNAARSAYATGDSASAKRYYASVKAENKGEAQAEATYYLAQFEFVQGNYTASNELILWMFETLPTYAEWRWRSLLLMAKNYAGLRDDFQANYILDRIIDECEMADVAQEAQEFKSNLVLLREREASLLPSADSVRIEIAPQANEP